MLCSASPLKLQRQMPFALSAAGTPSQLWGFPAARHWTAGGDLLHTDEDAAALEGNASSPPAEVAKGVHCEFGCLMLCLQRVRVPSAQDSAATPAR